MNNLSDRNSITSESYKYACPVLYLNSYYWHGLSATVKCAKSCMTRLMVHLL